MSNKTKDIDKKNLIYYFFNDMINIKIYDLNNIKYMEPNGHIFVYSQSIRRRKSMWKVHQK